MRKIEQQMVAAILNRKNMRSGWNRDLQAPATEVIVHRDRDHEEVFADVWVFGNHIARWVYPRPYVRTQLFFMPVVCSVTTKGRLSALLDELGRWQHAVPPSLYQRQFQWHLEIPIGPMNREPWIIHNIEADDVWRVAYNVEHEQFKAEWVGAKQLGALVQPFLAQAAA